MGVKVTLPPGLMKLAGNQRIVEVEARDVRGAIAELESKHPGIHEKLYDDAGTLKRIIRVFVNRKDTRGLQGDLTPLSEGDEIIILPAISGG